MAEPIRVLLAAAEVVGFAKTGGLADVTGALPVALSRRGHSCTVVLPLYRCARSVTPPPEPTPHVVRVPVVGRLVEGRLWRSTLPGCEVPVYLVEQPDYFDRDDPASGRGLYQSIPREGEAPQDYPDNCERFAFFCRAVLEAIRVLDLWPDVVHVHDWHTGLLPIYLRELYRHITPARLAERYARLATLFTFHNLAYQGLFPARDLERTGLGWHLFNAGQLEFHGRLNLLKAGLVGADLLSTVSPSYAREVQTPYYGCGLHGVLKQRSDQLFGILNGADYSVWGPAHDPHLPVTYDAGPGLLSAKARCKRDLQRQLGLAEESTAPLFGLVARLSEQKGPDLVARAFPTLLAEGAQLVVLGTGEPYYQDMLERVRAAFPSRVGLNFCFDEPLAHRILGGCDLFLMPSLYEPSGLTQLYAMRYGTPPVVRATGGLADTVTDTTPDTLRAGTATGFRFQAHTPEALGETIRRALALRREQPDDWLQVVHTGMGQDWSWNRSVAGYEELYERLRAGRPRT